MNTRRIPIRKATSPDVGRMSMGLQRPGMDTRVWSSLAYASSDSEAFDDGVFVDVVLLPTGEKLTARVPAEYAGASFGLYAKIYTDDELLIEIPRGDPAEGAVVGRRLWNKRHAPPAEAVAEPEDVLLVVKPEKTLRLITSGAGKIYVKSASMVTLEAPSVRLGDDAATEPLVLGNTYKGIEQQFLTQVGAGCTTLTAAATALTSAGGLMMIPLVGAMLAAPLVTAAAASMLAAATTINAGAGAFSGAIASALSPVSNTK